MKIGRWAGLLLLTAVPVLVGLSGCGDFWQDPYTTTTSGSGNCTSDCTTATSGNFYILNGGTTPEIVGESIVSGTLTAISGSPWALTGVGTVYSMAIAPNGNFLCVSTESGIFAYPISGGVLGTGTSISTDQAYAIQIDATSSWLIEALQGTGAMALAATPISSSTGANNGSEVTASFSVASAAVQSNQMAISPDNDYVFVALGQGGTIVVPFNESSPFPSGVAATAEIPVAHSSGAALSVAVDPSSRLFYIGESLGDSAGTSGGLRAFDYSSLSSGTLTPATGSPIASGGLAPNFILPVSSPDYVYVANGAGAGTAGNITGLSITGSSAPYTISTGSTTAVGIQPLGLAEDSSATFLFVVGSYSPYFDAYTFDTTTTGELDTQIGSTTAATFVAIVAAP